MSNMGYEDRVRREAYRLWEEAGRPGGQEVEFWHRACRAVDLTDAAPVDPAPKRQKGAKKKTEPAPAAKTARARGRKETGQSSSTSG